MRVALFLVLVTAACREEAGGELEADAAAPGAPDARPAGIDAAPPSLPLRVLFDNTKDEQAGNADWVVDSSGRYPSPEHPAAEDAWNGGFSSWGYELHQTGRYVVEQLPVGGEITFGDAGNDQDLSRYAVFIVPEPNSRFTAAEAEAVVAFVRAGGGLFVIGNHEGADRNNDGVDPPTVWNDFFTATGDPFGVRFAVDDITDSPDDNVHDDPAAPVLHGPFGHVAATTYYDGSTMIIDPTANPTVQALIWRRGAPHGLTAVTFAVATLDAGRVAAIGDSAPADDGTGAGNLLDGWNDSRGDNRELFLNATAWLARDPG